MNRTRFRPPIPTLPMPPRAAHRRGWDRTITIWWTISLVIVGVQATAARMSQETVAAQDMLARFTQWRGRGPESVAADTTYGNGEFLQWLADRSITPYMRTRDSIHRKRSPFFGPECFTYEPENNRYICPAGQFLNYGGRVYRNRAFNYIGTPKKCGPCSLRPQCTSAAFRGLIIHQTNQPDNVRGSWSTHQNSPRHNGRRKRKPCSRTEEPDRIAALASADDQVRARAVLPSSGSSEHQANGALSPSANPKHLLHNLPLS